MKLIQFRIFTILLIFNVSIVSGNIDSLKRVLDAEKQVSNRIKLYRSLYSFYCERNIDSANKYMRKFLSEGLKDGDQKKLYWGNYLVGRMHSINLKWDSALICYNNSKKYLNWVKTDSTECILYMRLAQVYYQKGNYDIAIPLYINELSIAEKNKYLDYLLEGYRALGFIYMAKNNLSKSVGYFIRSLELEKVHGDTNQISIANINVSDVLIKLGRYKDAKPYLDEAYRFGMYKKNERTLKWIYEAQADYCIHINDLPEAMRLLKQSMEISEKLKDYDGLIISCLRMGVVSQKSGMTKKCIEFSGKAYELCVQHNIKTHLLWALSLLNNSYMQLGDFKNANRVAQKIIVLKDSLYNVENNRLTAELEAKFQTQQKEKEIILHKSEIEKQQSEVEKQGLIKNTFIGGFIVMIIFALFIYRSYRQKKKINIEIMRQRELIEDKQKEILDSIRYAQRIQSALITSEKNIEKSINRLTKDVNYDH